MQMLVLMAIMMGGVLFLGLLAFAFYIFWDRFVRQPNYIRAVIFQRTGGFALTWLKKLSEEKSNYKLAYNPHYGKFAYFEKDIIPFKHYKAGFFAEDSCTSISLILSPDDVMKKKKAFVSLPINEVNQKLNIVVNDVLHPKTLQDIMDTKLLGELTGKDVDVVQIIILIVSVLVIIGLIALYFKVGAVGKDVNAVQDNLSMALDLINRKFLIQGAIVK